MELVDDFCAVDGGGGAVVEPFDVLIINALEVGDEDEAGGGEGAQEERAAVE